MRKLAYFVASSLDGYIATTDGRVDGLFQEGDYGYGDFDFILAGGKWHLSGKKGWVFSTSRTS